MNDLKEAACGSRRWLEAFVAFQSKCPETFGDLLDLIDVFDTCRPSENSTHEQSLRVLNKLVRKYGDLVALRGLLRRRFWHSKSFYENTNELLDEWMAVGVGTPTYLQDPEEWAAILRRMSIKEVVNGLGQLQRQELKPKGEELSDRSEKILDYMRKSLEWKLKGEATKGEHRAEPYRRANAAKKDSKKEFLLAQNEFNKQFPDHDWRG